MGPAILRARGRARIPGAFRRSRHARSPLTIVLLLHSAPAPQIFPVERAGSRTGDCRSSLASLEFSKCFSSNVARNRVAYLLERWRTFVDVDNSVKASGSDFSGAAATVIGACT